MTKRIENKRTLRHVFGVLVVLLLASALLVGAGSAEETTATPSLGSVYTIIETRSTGDVSTIWGDTQNTDPIADLHIDILDADSKKMGSVKLNDVDGIYAAATSSLTWHMMVYGEEYDTYWSTTWETGYPSMDVQPAKAVLYIDGEQIGDATDIQMNRADDQDKHTWEEMFPAAKIGDTEYFTIQKAINVATEGQTITLQRNATESDITVNADDNLIIDLNGKTVNGDFMVYGKATIKNGKIDSTNPDVSAIEPNGASADLTVENLDVTSKRHALRIDGGKATIISGKYTSTATEGTIHAMNISTDAQVTVKGGTFIGYGTSTNGNAAVATRGDNTVLTIEDGVFKNEGGSHTIAAWGGILNIKGGIFYKSATDTLNMGGGEKGTSETGISGGIFEDDPDQVLMQKGKDAFTIPDGEYAGWYEIDDAYTVIFYANGGDGSMKDQHIKADGSMTLTPVEDTLTKTAYTFNGWNTKADGSGKSYADGAAAAFDDKDVTTDEDKNVVVLLYAVWTPITYSISYNLDGGSVATENPTSYTIESDAITLTNPTKTGYTFAGWMTADSTATETVIIEKGSTGNKDYTATWTANTYTIKFDGNDADSGSTMSSISATYDVNVKLTNGFVKTGYNFAGWATTANGDVAINNDTEVRNLVSSGEIILYAVWTDKKVYTPATEMKALDPVTYDGAAKSFTLYEADENAGYTVTYKLTGADDSTYSTAAPKDAGTYDIRITKKADSTDYLDYSNTIQSGLVINKAPLTATYEDESIIVGGTPALKVTISGFVNEETAKTAADYVAPTVTAPTAAGTYNLLPSGGSAKNYDFSYASGTLTIVTGITYTITEGNSQKVEAGSDAIFVSNADYADFRGVQVDGKDVDSTQYIVESGSTKVTLKASYLSTLSAGEHTITIVSAGGSANATFTVAAQNAGGSPSSSSSGSSVWLTETPTQTPTPTPTETATPTDAVPTDIPVTQPTEEPASPGFGILAALAGLGAVAVLRRK